MARRLCKCAATRGGSARSARGGIRARRAAVEARFFLIEILDHIEDENLEALDLPCCARPLATPPSIRARAREPTRVSRAAGPRPACPQPAAGIGAADLVQRRFPHRPRRSDTEKPHRALDALMRLDPGDVRRAGWIAPWAAVYEAMCRARLGQSAGRMLLERAQNGSDVAGSRAAAREAGARLDDPLAAAMERADSALVWAGDAAAAGSSCRRRAPHIRMHRATRRVRHRLGNVCPGSGFRGRRGGIRACRFEARQRSARCDAAALRCCQALLWSGRLDVRARPAWHANRSWRMGTTVSWRCWSAKSSRRNRSAALRLESAAAGGEVFRLVDAGFTRVSLALATPRAARSGR